MALVLDIQICKINRSFLLTGEDVTVGTARGNSLRVSDSEVDSHHCVISLEGRRVFVSDLQSKSGTWVNGEIIQKKTAVVPGDVIAIGRLVVKLVENDNEEPDLYTKWLGVPPKPRPVDHYMLLGVPPYTTDNARLHQSADHRLETLEQYAMSPDRELRESCQKMMNEIAQAVTALTDPARRDKYNLTIEGRYSRKSTTRSLPVPPVAFGDLNDLDFAWHEDESATSVEATGDSTDRVVWVDQSELDEAVNRRSRQRAVWGNQKQGSTWLTVGVMVAGLAVAILYAAISHMKSRNDQSGTETASSDSAVQQPTATHDLVLNNPDKVASKPSNPSGNTGTQMDQKAGEVDELMPDKRQSGLDPAETPDQRQARLAKQEAMQAEAMRIAKIADLWKAALANDSNTNGKTALAALEELLKHDPNHDEAKKLRDKIAGYFGPPVLDLSNGVELATVHIKAGRFTMGSPTGETKRPNETQKSVTIDRDFYMGESEVTQAQWKAVMGTTPWKGQKNVAEGDDYPATYVSWDDAQSFMGKVSQLTGKKVRLPSEAEWEYACRAGTTTPFSFGPTISTDEANYNGNFTYGNGVEGVYRETTIPVGSLKKPNPWGLHDMHGNVWEWTSTKNRADDGQDEARGTSWRVLRGGSWRHTPVNCRSASRFWFPPHVRFDDFGFRVVVELSQDVVVDADRPIKSVLPTEIRPGFDVGGKSTEVDLGGGVKMELVRIEPGEFNMGSPANEVSRRNTETEHKVKIAKAFYMGVYEVTQGQYKAITGLNPSFFKGSDDLPVETVSWEEAIAFCTTLSEKEGKKYRLPTEAEWEYACRAGTTTAFSFGNTISTDEANYNGKISEANDNNKYAYGNGVKGVDRRKTIPVNSLKKPNPWGLHDMHGNVWEWCSDWYGDYPNGAATDPTGPPDGASRVLRGGGLGGSPVLCRSAYRVGVAPDRRNSGIGFRVVLELSQDVVDADRPIKSVLPTGIRPGFDVGGKSTEVVLGGHVKIKMIRIPAGQYTMGSPLQESYRYKDETPRGVLISKDYYLGETEVTQAQWKAVMGTTPWKGMVNAKDGEHYAATYINWGDVQEFLKKLSETSKTNVRLPTEAEWEHACRAGTKTAYSYGVSDRILSNYAWYAKNALEINHSYAHEVAQKKPNNWGLYDMHGNVLEWCYDWYGDYEVKQLVLTDPLGPISGSAKVLRGGGYHNGAAHCRSAFRIWSAPDFRNGYTGFRVAMDISGSSDIVVDPDEKSLAEFVDMNSIDKWRVSVWSGGKWNPRPRSAMDIEKTKTGFKVTNKTGVHDFAKIELSQPINGDFDLVAEYIGMRGMSLREADGGDGGIGTKWIDKPDTLRHRVEMSRRGIEWKLIIDGNQVNIDRNLTPAWDMQGYLGLSIGANESAEIISLSLKRLPKSP